MGKVENYFYLPEKRCYEEEQGYKPKEHGHMPEEHSFIWRSTVIWFNDFSGPYVLPAMAKGSTHTSLRPMTLIEATTYCVQQPT